MAGTSPAWWFPRRLALLLRAGDHRSTGHSAARPADGGSPSTRRAAATDTCLLSGAPAHDRAGPSARSGGTRTAQPYPERRRPRLIVSPVASTARAGVAWRSPRHLFAGANFREAPRLDRVLPWEGAAPAPGCGRRSATPRAVRPLIGAETVASYDPRRRVSALQLPCAHTIVIETSIDEGMVSSAGSSA